MSELIDWNEAWNTGIAAIDREHRLMAEALNRLLQNLPQACADCQSETGQSAIFEELISLTREHFHNEEQHMHRAGYPGLHAHRREHSLLVAELHEYAAEMRHGSSGSDIRTRRALKQWFIAHIVISDRDFARFYHARG